MNTIIWKNISFIISLSTCLLIGSNTIYSQEEKEEEKYKDINSPRKTYLYKSIDDMKSDKGEYVGLITEFTYNRLSHPIIHSRIKSEKLKNNVKKYWGFKIGDELYRMKYNAMGNYPLEIIGKKEFIFYVSGRFSIKKKCGLPATTFSTRNIYYSENIDSKMKYISSLTKTENKSTQITQLCSCIEKSKRVDSEQDQFDMRMECVTSFLYGD